MASVPSIGWDAGAGAARHLQGTVYIDKDNITLSGVIEQNRYPVPPRSIEDIDKGKPPPGGLAR
jgi:hypothetical protein